MLSLYRRYVVLRAVSSGSVKWLDKLLRDLSSAAERWDFQSPVGYQGNNSSRESNNTNGFDGGGQNPGGFPQNLNPRVGFKDVRESERKGTVTGQNPNELYENNSGPDRLSFPNENRRNTGREVGGFDVYDGKNDRNIQRNSTEVYSERAHGSWQNQNGVYGETSQGIRQSSNGYSQNRTGSYGGGGENVPQRDQIPQSISVSSSYSYNHGFQQQNAGTVQAQNSWSAQSQGWGSYNGGHGQAWQSPNAFYSQVHSHDQGNLSWNNTQSWQNPSTGDYRINSDYQSGWSSFQSGNASDSNTAKSESDVMIEEFDAFCEAGKIREAVTIIKSLTSKGHDMDLSRLLRLAHLCGEAEALQEAKAVHELFSASFSHSDVSSHNIMIEMYSNCGSMGDALSIFEKMPEKNLKTWYTIIRCLAKNDLGEDAIDMFTRFKNEGNKPDGQIFIAIFSACAALGDINEGLLHFESMYTNYGIIPTMEHYVSVVEMLAAPGYLDEALDFVEKMPMEPNVDVWETLMNLSRVHGNLELGDRCAELVDQLDATRLDKQSRAGLLPVKASDLAKEKLRKVSGLHKPLEIRSKVHEFRAGDTAHPENDKLYGILKSLKMQMVEMGYVADLRFVLHDVDPETKEEALLSHSERLAFAQGLLTTPARATIRVIKNLRVCVDCHNALKIMSEIVGREFVMRDAKRFHHLKDGVCTCKDYW